MEKHLNIKYGILKPSCENTKILNRFTEWARVQVETTFVQPQTQMQKELFTLPNSQKLITGGKTRLWSSSLDRAGWKTDYSQTNFKIETRVIMRRMEETLNINSNYTMKIFKT